MKKVIKIASIACFITLFSFAKLFAQSNVTFTMNDAINDLLEIKVSSLNQQRETICTQVGKIAYDVKTGGNGGGLIYPNWVRFYQIAHDLDALNDEWNEAYGDALDKLVNTAITTGASNANPNDEHQKDLLSDIFEEQYLHFEADIASVCFETRFNHASLRKCLEEQEDYWLQNQDPNNFMGGEAPTIAEELEDEEFWTLITCEKQFTILNTTIDETTLLGLTDEQKKDILATIKDIVGVLGGVVDIAKEVVKLLEDCSTGTSATDRNIRHGIDADLNGNYMYGYLMKQHGVVFDWDKTITKIKGKVKLWKKKSNGKYKKDRRGKVAIQFCAKEENMCVGLDWPQDPPPYFHPRIERRKKAKITKFRQDGALGITKSYHFVKFAFDRNNTNQKRINLLGTTDCN